MEIVQIDPRLIDDHPRNSFIYGMPPLDEAFLTSVRTHGIRQPLTVVRGESGRFIAIGGHRRKYAAIQENLETVPCEIVESEGEQSTLQMLVLLNIDREKTPGMRWREMSTLELTLSEGSNERKLKGLSGEQTGAKAGLAANAAIEGKTAAKLAETFHYSRGYIERLQAVYSDRYRAEFARELETKSKAANRLPDCLKEWDKIRAKCEASDMSVSGAAAAVIKLKKETIKPGRGKKEKTAKVKKPLPPMLKFKRWIAGKSAVFNVYHNVHYSNGDIELGTIVEGDVKLAAILVHGNLLTLTAADVEKLKALGAGAE